MDQPSEGSGDDVDQNLGFEIQGPDDKGHVWVCDPGGRHIWCRNLGPYETVAEKWPDWLGQRDFGE